ncbi:hypothetical protein AQ436_00205 [Arthrobacter sp. EpRS66]|nr:hypothetical protein AQ436_00205 [Arthrobacter sp. EpRS66]
MWFKVDDGFHSSRKLLSIPKRHRLAAAGLWVIAGSWCGQQLTNGRVPDYMLKEWGATPATVQALLDSGLWEVESDANVFYKWHEYQPSKRDVDAERAASRERMRDLRAKRKGVKPQESGAKDDMFVRTSPNGSESVRNPDPTRPDPTIDTSAKALGDYAADPEALFDEPAPKTPEPEIIQENAGAIIAQWIESQSQRPPGRVIGQLSKEIKTLLDEGHAFSEVLAATQSWSRKSLHPSTLASVLHEARNPRTMTAGAEQRMQVGMSLIERVAAKGKGGLDFDPFEQKEIES